MGGAAGDPAEWPLLCQVYEASGDGSCTHPALLKDQICSPAGATIAGLMELESANVRSAFMRAVKAAAKRSEGAALRIQAAVLQLALHPLFGPNNSIGRQHDRRRQIC